MSAHRFLNPEQLLPGQGFSHVALVAPGAVVEIAGQTAHQPDGSVRGASMAEQADAALSNLATALRAAGAQAADLVSIQIYVTSVQAYRDDLVEIGAAWQKHLGKHYPTVSLFGVAELFDPAARIEILARAVIADPPRKGHDMGSLLVHITHGVDAPTRAALGFLVARSAVQAGHDVNVFLAGDAAQLITGAVVENLRGIGTGPLAETVPAVVEGGAQIYVSGMSAKARGVTEADLEATGAQFALPDKLVELTFACDRILTY